MNSKYNSLHVSNFSVRQYKYCYSVCTQLHSSLVKLLFWNQNI
uniref:Uncharacterized protein n=1 Tax=Setaria italica TaxID=4555 RepID=K3XUD4_SETIT